MEINGRRVGGMTANEVADLMVSKRKNNSYFHSWPPESASNPYYVEEFHFVKSWKTNNTKAKVQPKTFRLNGSIIGFHSQAQKLEQHLRFFRFNSGSESLKFKVSMMHSRFQLYIKGVSRTSNRNECALMWKLDNDIMRSFWDTFNF